MTDTTLTPPPSAPADTTPYPPAAPAPGQSGPGVPGAGGPGGSGASGGSGGPAPSGSARAIAILTIVLGSVLVVGTIASSVFSTVAISAVRHSATQTATVDGVTELDVLSDAGDVTIMFGDVTEATLEVTDTNSGAWTLERDGDALHVAAPQSRFLGWIFGRGPGRATLTLPESLRGVDATMTLTAGSLTAEGEFGDLDLTMTAGDMQVTGSATELDASVSAGSADIDLSGVQEASFDVTAGDTSARLTDTAPTSTEIRLSAGSLDIELPDTTYDLRSDVSAGDLDDSRLQTSTSSPRTITANVTAGDLVLRGA